MKRAEGVSGELRKQDGVRGRRAVQPKAREVTWVDSTALFKTEVNVFFQHKTNKENVDETFVVDNIPLLYGDQRCRKPMQLPRPKPALSTHTSIGTMAKLQQGVG